MAQDDDTSGIPQTKLAELAMSPSERRRLEDGMQEMSKTLVRLREEYAPAAERFLEVREVMQSVSARYLESANAAYESVQKLVAPVASVLALQKGAIGTICETVMRPSFLDSIKSAMDVSARYQEMMKDMAVNRTLFNASSLVDTLYEMPVYRPEPLIHRDPTVQHIHVNVHIEKMIVHRDGRPTVAVPEAGCVELDPYFYLCCKHKEKKYGLHYFKGGEYQYEELTALQARILQYFHDVGFRVHTFAQKLDTIADALQSSKRSISNRINELEKIFERLKIQDLLQKVGDNRWCLSRQLGCFEGTWL
ncbi:hypothetical protein EXS65_05075 [Candidatus Peribacteria bacterium]|nr:hypothetical protein [Candidatus Peribacteria bacterium]